VSASLASVSVLGVANTDVVPVLATSRDLITGPLTTSAFIDFKFQTNPLNEDCDTSIFVAVQPAEVKYDAVSLALLLTR